MRLRAIPLVLALLATCALAGARAYAGDGDRRPPNGAKAKGAGQQGKQQKDYVAELQPKELEFLESRIKGWDKLDAHKKQMIARNVVRLRNMSPEQRKHFERRLKSMRGKSKRWDRMRDHGGRMLVDRGLAHAARKKLGREFEARLRRSDISEHVFERSFGRTFWGKVTQTAFADGKPVALDALPKGASERFLKRYSQMLTRWEATDDAEQRGRMLSALGHSYSQMLAGQLRHELARSDVKGSDAYVALVARKVRQTWPKEFAESLQDPDALLRSAENHEVKRSLHRLLRRDGRLMGEEALLMVRLVERWTLHLAKSKRSVSVEAGAEADALIKRVLREQFKVEPEVLEAMPPRSEIEQRAAWYQRVFARKFGRSRGMRGPGSPWGSRDGRKGPGPRLMRALERPEGLSDEDWSAYIKAPKGAGRPFLRSKPEGVSDAGWKLIKAALKKRMEAVGRRRGGK